MAVAIEQSNLAGVAGDRGWGFRGDQDDGLISRPPAVRATADLYVAPPVRWAFYAFVATIPFEEMDLGIPVEITMISLGIVIASLAFHMPLIFRKPPLAYSFFLLYLVIFSVPFFLQGGTADIETIWPLLVTTQLIVMSWVAYILLRSDRIARMALAVLGLSCLIVALLQLSGVSLNTTEFGRVTKRVTAFGFHPNNIARILSLGLLALIGLAYGQRRSFIQPRWAVWVAFVAIGIAIVQTGSRGGLLALGAGLLVFVLPAGNITAKIRNALLVAVGIGFFVFVTFQFEGTVARFDSALSEGDLARREKIFPVAWQMFLEKPVVGWGPITAQFELGARLAHVNEDSKNAHNMVLNILITSGLAGAIPLFAGTFLALCAAWRARGSTRGILPLSLMTTVLVANMSGYWVSNKMHWLVIAYALASGSAVVVRKFTRQLHLQTLNLSPDRGI